MFKKIKSERGSEDRHGKMTSEAKKWVQREVQGECQRDQQYEKFEGRDLLRVSKSGAE